MTDLQRYPIFILLIAILSEDLVLRLIYLVLGREKEFSPLLAPVSFLIYLDYSYLIKNNSGLVESTLFLTVLSGCLAFSYFLVIFPLYFYKKYKEN